jgi:hypothetical protein
VPAAASETAYRRNDHCALELLLRGAEAQGWDGGRTSAAIAALGEAGTVVPTSSPLSNGDPTLRLVEGETPVAECLDEIFYDRAGYANYSPFLPDQDPGLTGALVIARDLRWRNRRLADVHPHRTAYVYRDGQFLLLDGPAP